jgi:hypothetical protein
MTMSRNFDHEQRVGRYSAGQSDEIVRKRIALTQAFCGTIKRYIDRINRKGADIEMDVKPYDAATKTQVVQFRLRRDTSIQVSGTLEGDVIKYEGMQWGGHQDFERLVPRIARDLVTMSASDRYDRQMSALQGPSTRL